MNRKFAGISLEKSIIMGILNLSKKTFYKDSLAKNPKEVKNRTEKMIENGAQIIDIGGMSTGPNVKPISVEREKELLIPSIENLREEITVPISVDTQRSEVAKEAIEAGADIINDISGFKADENMAKIVSEYDCHAILMANRIYDRLRTAEKKGKDVSNMKKIMKGLKENLKICKEHGINLEKIAIDPGIGFGKDAKEDILVLSNLDALLEFNLPICIGVSRKSFIGKILEVEKPSERLPGSLGATAVGIFKNSADIIRTHDPKETFQFVRMIEKIQEEEED
ncbi:hypothetical protein AKJ49_00935 [candidate division MSBL1 archaeon SCGC-AAA382A03]|uniref:dihydropteroate synthase n=1 Tax=candidate division MSBL1 archaeon SCGC-AAA382A03 TaxID=1698278 RepID=A0A133VFZ2_9EURY|nr:hypothetical protein AKJ49_00935 [candidate division MSBL1 archaeon SCGC-AAA382A03]